MKSDGAQFFKIMHKLCYGILLTGLACSQGCNSKGEENHSSINTEVTARGSVGDSLRLGTGGKKVTAPVAKSNCIPQIKQLVAWTHKNMDTIARCPFVGISQDSSHRLILFKNTSRYLMFLKQSDFFSDKFLSRQNDVFLKVNNDFSKDNGNIEYIPAEMAYNMLSISNEPDEDFANYKSFVYKEKQSLVYVTGSFGTLIYKVDAQCKVDSIYRR